MRDQLKFLMDAGETRRFHTVPVLREQRVDSHSWRLALLLYVLYGQEEPGVSMILLMAALAHDGAEQIVGDLPAPSKRNMDEVLSGLKHFGGKSFRDHWGDMEQKLLSKVGMDFEKYLNDEEKRRLKLCDSMEGMLYCLREREMGNQKIAECFANFHSYVWKLLIHDEAEKTEISDREWEAFNFISKEWDSVTR